MVTWVDCQPRFDSAAVMIGDRPKLSICIPTYSRADLLDVCLATVLPQVRDAGDLVECVICDNDSTDHTADIIQRYAESFPLRSVRNETNIGVLGNVTKVAGQIAHGEFAWLIGDDDCLMTGAVQRVLDTLQDLENIDLLTVNVGFRSSSLRPSVDDAYGGISDEPASLLRKDEVSGTREFSELLTGPNADFTAMYSVVLRQSLWRGEFPQAYDGEPFSDVRSTYPHAHIIAKTQTKNQVALIADPMVMMHELAEEQFSWAKYQPLTVVLRFTELLDEYAEAGVGREVLEPYYQNQIANRSVDLGRLIWNKECVGGWRDALGYARRMKGYPVGLVKAFCLAMCDPSAPRLLSAPFRFLMWLKRSVSREIAD